MLQVDPHHDVYTRHGGNLEFCLPCMLHGDEGVGHRRKPVMQLLWGPLLRAGLGAIHRLFLITTCPHKYYSKFNMGAAAGNPVLDRLMLECGRSASRSYYTGIETEYGRFFLVFLGLAGDHPFQVKVCHSLRGHLRVEVCPWCHASTRSDVPFEDFGLRAAWRKTIFQSVPWSRDMQPPMFLVPGGDHPGFLKWDLLHMITHGCARNFCASITCMLCGPMGLFSPEPGPGKRKERCLDAAFAQFDSWLACTGQSVRDLKEFTPENLQWINNRDFPDSNCKAADTTLWIKWLLDLLGTMPWRPQEPLEHAYEGLLHLDAFLRLCYTHEDRLFLVPFSSRMGVSTSWNSCLPLRLWLSTGSTAIGVCLATRQSAIIQPTGMKNFGMPFAKASVGLGNLQHLPHQWWKILLGFAPECQEVHMPVVFQLVPLGSIWFTPCKCGNEKKRVGVGWSWVANPSNVQLTYSGDTYVVESCGIHNLWKFLWTTIFDRTNYCWISRLPNKK